MTIIHDIFFLLGSIPFILGLIFLTIFIFIIGLDLCGIPKHFVDKIIDSMFNTIMYDSIILITLFYFFPITLKIFMFSIMYFIIPWIIPSFLFPYFLFPKDKIKTIKNILDPDDVMIYDMNMYTWKLILLEIIYITMAIVF